MIFYPVRAMSSLIKFLCCCQLAAISLPAFERPSSLVLEELEGFEQVKFFVVQPVSVTVRNDSDRDLIIDGISSDCPCLTFDFEPVELKPGDQKTVTGDFSVDHLGPYKRELTFSLVSEDGAIENETHPIRGQCVLPAASAFISAEVVSSASQNYDIWDLRDASSYRRFRIAGSSLVDPSLPTLTVRERPVVLVTEAYPSPIAIRLYEKLGRANPGQVKFLSGGLLSWAQQGYALTGTAPLDSAIAFVQPEQVLRLSTARPILWLVGLRPSEVLSLPAEFEVCPWEPSHAALVDAIARPQYFLTADNNTALQEVRRMREERHSLPPVPFIAGGLQGFSSAIEKKQALAYSAANQEIRRVSTARNGTAHAVVASRRVSGCNSCSN